MHQVLLLDEVALQVSNSQIFTFCKSLQAPSKLLVTERDDPDLLQGVAFSQPEEQRLSHQRIAASLARSIAGALVELRAHDTTRSYSSCLSIFIVNIEVVQRRLH